MSPDWSAKPQGVPYAKLGNPQSLNLYAYVMNNPITFNDPTGHDICSEDQSGHQTGCQTESKWHNFWYGNTYKLNADNGKTYKLDAPLKELKNGQKYTLVDEKTTRQGLNDMVMNHIGQPGQGPGYLQVSNMSLTAAPAGIDFKPELNRDFGPNALFLIGDNAHRSDFIGNVAWGFIMGSFGYGETMAHIGAGAQQIGHDAMRGGPFEGTIRSLGDDPNDYRAIHEGYQWWNGDGLQ